MAKEVEIGEELLGPSQDVAHFARIEDFQAHGRALQRVAHDRIGAGIANRFQALRGWGGQSQRQEELYSEHGRVPCVRMTNLLQEQVNLGAARTTLVPHLGTASPHWQ